MPPRCAAARDGEPRGAGAADAPYVRERPPTASRCPSGGAEGRAGAAGSGARPPGAGGGLRAVPRRALRVGAAIRGCVRPSVPPSVRPSPLSRSIMSAQERPPALPSRAAPDAAEWDAGNGYEAVAPHWFYCKVTGGRERWLPFSTQDSERLEEAHGAGRGSVRTPPPLPPSRPACSRCDRTRGWCCTHCLQPTSGLCFSGLLL